MPETNALSDREMDILRLVATGASNKEIAQELIISINTVKVHLRNIYSKLDVTSRTEATLYAVRVGIVHPQGEAVADELVEGDGTSLDEEDEHTASRLKTYWPLAVLGVLVIVILGLLGVDWWMNRANPAMATQPPTTAFETSRWEDREAMPTSRSGLAVVAYENLIYAIGGETNEEICDLVERYDPEEDTWQDLTSKPVPVTDVGAVVIGGMIYVPGGRTSAEEVTDVLEVYDPLQGRWETRNPLPIGLSAYAIAAFEGRLYLFGGWDGEEYVDSVIAYSPDDDAWQSLTTMPTARGFAGAAVAGGKIYVIGGYDGGKSLQVNEEYWSVLDDGVGNPWTVREPLPESRHSMGVTSAADIIHLIGGNGNSDAGISSWKYFPQEDHWTDFEEASEQSWSQMGLTTVGTKLYAIGGKFGGAVTSLTKGYQAVFTVLVPVIR
jgi:DNA-binding CsgD family transcriptional regulator